MKILTLFFPGFTAVDFIGPANAWALVPGMELQTAAKKAGPVRMDMGSEIIATHSFDNCWEAPDVLLIPGGATSLFDALQDDAFIDVVARIGARSGWVTSVCNGSLVLGAAGLLRGYEAACYWYSRDYLALFGAKPNPARVVIDRNRATGGGMTAGIDFGLRMVGIWRGEAAGRLLELQLEYAPEPPFQAGRPELALPETLAIANEELKILMPNSVAKAAAVRRGFMT